MKKISFLFFWLLGYGLVAQTTGPTQPEAAEFQPFGADNMVNLYTGDFTYNLPLMVVPGPDGGYPINLFYSGNVSMDQTASWAGLGWNLNCGAIQRNLRGLPDDFKGDEVERTFWTKPSFTLSIDASAFQPEILGADLKKLPVSLGQNYSIYYNNYGGLGVSAGVNVGPKVDENGLASPGLHGSLGLSFDSQEGINLSPSISYDYRNETLKNSLIDGKGHSLSLGGRINSKQGFTDLDMRHTRTAYQRICYVCREGGTETPERTTRYGTGLSFAASAPLGPLAFRRTTATAKFTTEIDPAKVGLAPSLEKVTLGGSLTVSTLSEKEQSAPAYGAMYLSARAGKNSLADFYRENEGALTKDKVITPIPVLTYDVFSIQGHGIGGSFRAYQNSVGKLSDPVVNSNAGTGALGLEQGYGAGVKWGFDIHASFTRSYSGPWKQKGRFQKNLAKYAFEAKSGSKPLFEPFYFKMIGETQPMPLNQWAGLEEDDPLAFDIKMTWDVLSAKIRALNTLNHANRELQIDKYPDRRPRVHSIEYFTHAEIENGYGVTHIYDRRNKNNLQPITFDGSAAHSLEALSILKPNGVRYNYFLPAYNKETVKETFAIPGTTSGNPKVIKTVDGQPVETYAAVNNGAGEDEFYSREVIPRYAHTFFLTSILSQDYVDINNNGPDSVDIGSWVKFIYEKVPDYQWRFPYEGAYFTKGYFSNKGDDKASWQEGTKDLYYVKAIETKTHIAVFETADSELEGANGVPQKQLRSISLYSKSAPDYRPDFYVNNSANPLPIQTVHLHQNYWLRPGTPNASSGFSPALDSLHFTYYDSKKGENAKYVFRYGENPAYKNHQQDRWGVYQPDRGNVLVNENPYTYQEESYGARDDEAAAWLMDEVVLPSKGRITIDYERDDYAYVQDRPATSFVELVGSGNSTGNYNSRFDANDEYLYFRSPYPLSNNDDVKAQLEGLEYVRFRVFLDLKFSDRLLGRASDYVEGYAKVLGDAKMLNSNIGYFKIERIKPKSTSAFRAHPVRLAAWQYIRKSRPDLGIDFGDITNVSPAVFGARNAVAMVNEVVNLFGYYNNARIKGWAKEMDNRKPSYVRLVNPQRKYGGGARVKQITLHTNDDQNPTYGQTYHYELPNGRSSGVAEFEPLVGGEESPFTQPVWYNANNDGSRILFSNEQSFHEEPLGAGLYPSAQVGYSRVWVRNLTHDSIQMAQSGISVSEFFTARDFPTRFDSYGAMLQEYPVKVMIPFIGLQSFNNTGYSMGYSFTLNNAIYGRPRSEATYPFNKGVPEGQPIQQSIYRYQTAAGNPHALDNKIVALRKEGQKETVLMGREVDFYIDEIEAHTWQVGAGSQVNLNVQGPVWLPSWFPSIGFTESNTRYLTTNKVIFNIPILESVEQYKDGAMVETSNLFYDYETGDPIITSVTNEWERPIYTYNFPAHWTYEQMKGAATNYGASLKISSSGSRYQLDAGTVSGKIPPDLLLEGDLIRMNNGQKYYVTDLDRDANTFSLTARAGNRPGTISPTALLPANGKITQSGFKNLQSTRKGKIVSLQDWSGYIPWPGTDLYTLLLEKYNVHQPRFTSSPGSQSGLLGQMDLTPCVVEPVDVRYSYNERGRQLIFYFDVRSRGACSGVLDLSASSVPFDSMDVSRFRFLLSSTTGASAWMRYDDLGHPLHGALFPFDLQNMIKCFECPKPKPIAVLHADATEFKEDWALNYRELEDESTDITGVTMTDIASGTTSANPYAYGLKGIWRPWRTSAYLIDRRQTGTYGDQTRIDVDGEYEKFYWFDWQSPMAYNEENHWRWVNEVTQYNVNGSSKEGRNRLDIHAASLFGYQNHLATAAASNSKTTDIAFDGFEDYGPAEPINHGNFSFNANSNTNLFEIAHTGNRALIIGSTTTFSTNSNTYLQPEPGKRYVISAWVYMGSNPPRNITFSGGEIEVWQGTSRLTSLRPDFTQNQIIDGWIKIEGSFVPTSSTIEIRLIPRNISSTITAGKAGVFDDLRIQPFNSGMETYVYDPSNYRLLATLSNQNYATFYNYDEEGNLIQTKVETERGVKTISQNRQNIKE